MARGPTPEEVKQKNSFLFRMAQQFSSKGPKDPIHVIGVHMRPDDISRLLRKAGLAYNPAKEASLEKALERILQVSKPIKVPKVPAPLKCTIPGCKGILLKDHGRVTACSIGGKRHVIVAKIAESHGLDPLKLLEQVSTIHAERQEEQDKDLKFWKEKVFSE